MTKTIRDYAELSYWFGYRVPESEDDTDNQYLSDVHNPHSGVWSRANISVTTQPVRTNQLWGDFREEAKGDTWGKRQAIDCTISDQQLQITDITRLGDRDYLIDFRTSFGTPYQYVVQDCNHEQHAFNRFAKRVRQEINPRLGTTMEVVDKREPKEQEEESDMKVYSLFISINFTKAVEVCSHTDVLSLIKEGRTIKAAFDKSTPNVEVQLRDIKGTIVATITENRVHIF